MKNSQKNSCKSFLLAVDKTFDIILAGGTFIATTNPSLNSYLLIMLILANMLGGCHNHYTSVAKANKMFSLERLKLLYISVSGYIIPPCHIYSWQIISVWFFELPSK